MLYIQNTSATFLVLLCLFLINIEEGHVGHDFMFHVENTSRQVKNRD